MMNSINIICTVAAVVCWVVVSHSAAVMSDNENFSKQVKSINDEIGNWYKKELGVASRVNHALHFDSEARRQSMSHHWPRQMMKVLQLATGYPSSDKVHTDRLDRIVAGLKQNDLSTQREFVNNLGVFMSENLNSEEETSGDRKKKVFYEQRSSLCAPYSSISKGHFEGAINDLLRIKLAEQVDDDEFNKQVIYTDQPIAMLYKAAMICEYLNAVRDEVDEDLSHLKLDIVGDTEKILKEYPYPTKDYPLPEDSSELRADGDIETKV